MGKLTLEGLEILDAIDRKGSFTGAADELHKVPSTISYTVGKIEDDLQVVLFRRSGPRVEITDAGRELLREGRLLLQAASDLECKVKRVASGWESSFHLVIDSALSTDALTPLVAEFQKIADATTLRIGRETLTGTWESLLDLRTDLVVATGRGPAGGGYQAREVGQTDFWFCVAPFHPLAKAREPLSEATIRAHRAVVIADSARRLPLHTSGILTGQDRLVVPDVHAKLRFQAEGLGVGWLPAPCARNAVESGVLLHKQVEVPRAPEPLNIAWRIGAEGNALAWWIARLTRAGAMQALLESSMRAFEIGGTHRPDSRKKTRR